MNKRTAVITGGLAAIFVMLSVLARFLPRFPGDLPASLLLQSIRSASLLTIMEGISYVTDGWRAAIIVVAGAIIIWLRIGRLEAGLVALSGIITTVNEVLKIAVNRSRPPADLVTIFVAETGRSFPSGHAFFAALVLGMLTYFATTRQTRPAAKIITISVSLALILWIGASRIYLGAHWLSDVIGGYIIGSLFLLLGIQLYRSLKARLKNPERI